MYTKTSPTNSALIYKSPQRSPFDYPYSANNRPWLQTRGDTVGTDPMFLNGGYWPSWKYYEGGSPSSVPAIAITHVHYAFADIDGDGTVYLADENVHFEANIDGTNGGLRAWTQRKMSYPNLRVTLAIGGGSDGISAKFVEVVADDQKLSTFVRSTKCLVDQFALDGVDIDWEYPSEPHHVRGYIQLLGALRSALEPEMWITTALPAARWVLTKIDLTRLSRVVDFINLMAYDMAGPHFAQSKTTGHHAQLFAPRQWNTAVEPDCGAAAVDYLLARGVPSRKIMLGIPCYGHIFTGACLPDQPFDSPRDHEETTYEVKDLPRPGMREVLDSEAVAAYASGGHAFATYDNSESVVQKAEYVKRKHLRGLFYWHLAGDRVGETSLVRAGFDALHAQE